MTVRHLYLHVPFCVRRCSYCDFAVTVAREAPSAAWLDAIGAELRLAVERERLILPFRLRTLYVGGGTPSSLGAGTMAALRGLLDAFACWDDDLEWTAEANPESFTRAVAEDWRAAGVNRVSLGAQAFHASSLRWMGRQHGVDGPARAFATAREAGFDNINVDLIFGLPRRLGRDLDADVARVIDLAPEHVSLYGLTAEPATPLGRWVADGRERLADDVAYEAEFLTAAAALAAAGFEHYEVSNFARGGRESRHNRAYWEGAAYLGLGPGAHSFLPPRRLWNTRDWAEYARLVGAGESARVGEENVDADAAALERVWLGLRTTLGIGVASPEQIRLAEDWQGRGWATLDRGHLRLTPRGWLLLDRLAVDLAAAA